jgi:hypothetical protein
VNFWNEMKIAYDKDAGDKQWPFIFSELNDWIFGKKKWVVFFQKFHPFFWMLRNGKRTLGSFRVVFCDCSYVIAQSHPFHGKKKCTLFSQKR